VGFLSCAPCSGGTIGRSFVDVLRSSPSVEGRSSCFEAEAVDVGPRALDLFPVSSCFEAEADDVGYRSAVDCSALEWLPRLTEAATGSVRLKKKQSGIFGNVGLMTVLGFFNAKMDRILSGLHLKPNRRKKRFLIFSKPIRRRKKVGFLDKAAEWAVSKAGSGLLSDPSSELGQNMNPDLIEKLGSPSVIPTHKSSPTDRSPAIVQSCSTPEDVLNSALAELSLIPVRPTDEINGSVSEGFCNTL
jgi:hypothetical protein